MAGASSRLANGIAPAGALRPWRIGVFPCENSGHYNAARERGRGSFPLRSPGFGGQAGEGKQKGCLERVPLDGTPR